MISYPTLDATSGTGDGALVRATVWIQSVLLGNVAVSVSIIAIAAIGFGLLSGRVDVRRGATVIIGCFILFGASAIVSGLINSADTSEVAEPDYTPAPPTAVAVATSPAPPQGYDPYAGASVPSR